MTTSSVPNSKFVGSHLPFRANHECTSPQNSVLQHDLGLVTFEATCLIWMQYSLGYHVMCCKLEWNLLLDDISHICALQSVFAQQFLYRLCVYIT